MKLVSPKLLASEGAIAGKEGHYFHWCPACETLHPLPVPRWSFNGDINKPHFNPSFRQQPGHPKECHYHIHNGNIEFCGDGWHKRSDTIVMPDIPEQEVADWCDDT